MRADVRSLPEAERLPQPRKAIQQSGLRQRLKFGIAIFTQRLRQRKWLSGKAKRFGDLVFWHLNFLSKLSQGCRAAILQFETGAGLLQASEGVTSVDWKSYGATGIRDATGDGLTDPPCCVRGEFEALTPVELFDGVHEAEVPLLDEVKKRQA